MSRHMFSAVPHIYRPRSQFSRDHTLKTTFDTGYLVPVYCDEVLPGDTKKVSDVHFARMSTPIFPVMDDLYFDTFYFFVPSRLVWEHWENFMFQREDPLDQDEKTDYVIPTLTLKKSDCVVGDIFDHFGLPVCNKHFTGQISVNSLPFRCYNRIWNDWFRDENLQSPVVHRRTDTGDVPGDFKLLRRGKRHDMFTSCLPSPQLGEPIRLSFGGGGPQAVYGDGSCLAVTGYNSSKQLKIGNLCNVNNGFLGAQDSPGKLLANRLSTSADCYISEPYGIGVATKDQLKGASSGLQVDLGALSVTVEQWRQAVATQLLMERLMTGGHRYVEMLYSIFGVTQPDGRLQRAEYLGGSSTLINTTPVLQTSATDAKSPQGNTAGFTTVSHAGHAFRRTFTEHGYIIGLAQVRAKLSYSQGLQKMWTRQTPYDFWWPYWDNLGEEAVKEKEIYCTGVPAEDDKAFGYQERGYEYRYYPDMVTGKFRPDIDGNLASWHYSQLFDQPPRLNASFIEDIPPVKRTLAVQDEPEILLDAKFIQTDSREMSLYSIPGVGRHF